MIDRLDFSMTLPMWSAMLVLAAMPITLAVVAWLPWLLGRNALQFLVGTLLTLHTLVTSTFAACAAITGGDATNALVTAACLLRRLLPRTTHTSTPLASRRAAPVPFT